MRNKNVGYLVCGLAIVMGFIVVLFNKALKDIVSATCSHGPSCAMNQTIAAQTWFSGSLAALIFILGLFLVFSKEEVIIKKVKERAKRIDTSKLENEEKELVEILENEGGAIFQSALMEKMNMGKVKATRLLDKLEAKQIIERKRRGMNNIVVLKR